MFSDIFFCIWYQIITTPGNQFIQFVADTFYINKISGNIELKKEQETKRKIGSYKYQKFSKNHFI